MKATTRRCWRDVLFPKTGLMVAPFIYHLEQRKLWVFPLMRLLNDLDELTVYYQTLKLKPEKEMVYTDNFIVVPLTFDQFYPNRPDHWGGPGKIQPTVFDRLDIFAKVCDQPQFYRILVTVDGRMPGGPETFTVDMPFLLTAQDKDIDQYIRNSNLPVDETAKNSALYLPGESYGYNWETKEITKNTKVSYPGN